MRNDLVDDPEDVRMTVDSSSQIRLYKKHPGGRPCGVTMPCGWGCGRRLTAREMREHFTTCPNRPAK